MKDLIIFIVIFVIIFSFVLFIFNGRFVYAQLKYNFIGPPPVFSKLPISFNETGESLRLIIPLIGIDAPIILPGIAAEYIIQEALKQGVVRYPDSNIILGHSSAYPWYKGQYGSVFSLLNKLEKGDEILIYSGKEKYTYQVLEKQIKLPKNLVFQESDSIIYLVSCWPVSTNWKRIVIKAEILDPVRP